MSRRISLTFALLGVMLIVALLPTASFADPANPPPPAISYPSTGLNPPASRVGTNGHVAVMIELAMPAVIVAPNGLNSQSAHQQITAAQTALISQLAVLNARVLFQTSLVYAGVAVTIPADQLERLRALPGVARVTVIPPKLPSVVIPSMPAGALPAVAAVAATTGRGMRIGIIDRGIDYTHADFGGPGTPLAYLANDPTWIEPGSFPTAKVEGFDFAGDNYDATATIGSETPVPDADPRECMQPDVHAGRGSNISGLAAGLGVAADGTPYHGPYGPGTDFSTLRIAPGVAPEAQLYALKVFGCHGSTALLTQAIERAVDPNGDGNSADHLDVVIISVGTPFGSDDDPDAIAVNNAVRAGVVVVVAAGDDFATFSSVDSPASASLAIAVGATDGNGGIAAFSARGPQRGNRSLKVDIAAPGVNVRSAVAGTGSDAAAISGTAAAAAQVGGAAALLRQLHSEWTPAQIKAALIDTATPINAPPSLTGGGQLNLAGLDTVSLLAYGADGGGLNYGAPWVASTWIATRTLQLENTGDATRSVTLTATSVVTETGVTLQPPVAPITIPAHSSAQATITMTIDPRGLEFSPDATTATTQDGFARHYLAEHGGSITISSASGGSGVRVRPAHAAHFGSVDFYLDDHLIDDSLDSREVEDYVSTTPGPHVVNLRRPGASLRSAPIFSAPVNLLDGYDYTLILVGRPGELGLVIADENTPAPPPAGQSLIHFVNANRVGVDWNIGPLDVYLDGLLQVTGLAVGATSAYFPLVPGTHEVVFFHAGANPALARRVARKTFVARAEQTILLGTGRHDDDDGRIDDKEQRAFIGYGDIRLLMMQVERVPFHVFPTVAAAARAATALNVVPSAREFALGLLNTGARNSGLNGSQATPRTPLASAFELAATSPPMSGLRQTIQAADIQYLGITSSYSVTGNLGPNTSIFFGLSSYAPWSTPNEIQARIYIDSNQDGIDDFVLMNTNWGAATNGNASDVFLNGLFPLQPDGTLGLGLSYAFWGSFTAPIQSTINIAPFNTSVMFQSIAITNLALPLDPSNPTGPKGATPSSFCYHVETHARDAGDFEQVVDRVPEAGSAVIAACGNRAGVLQYNIQNSAIAPINTRNFIFGSPTAARPIFVDIDGGAITGGVNPAQLAARPGTKLLILHHHNASFPQAEVVDVNLPISAAALGVKTWVRVPLVMR
jgi:Subtilase family/Domain of unknown function (DUF4397)